MQGLVTVFGGSGFIGRYVVRALAKDGWRVRVAVRRPNKRPELKVIGDVGQIELVQANVRDAASVARALDGADAVVNLVGVLFQAGPQKFDGLHRDAARDIAQAAAGRGITRFVQMSALGASLDSPSDYARSKAEGEAAVRAAIPTAAIIRPSVVFGVDDSFFNKFAGMAAISPVLPLIGGGKTRFQPVYAGDVGAAFAVVLASPDSAGKTYELGGPMTYSFKELMQLMLKETLLSRVLVPVPFALAGPLGAIGGLVSAIGFAPPVTRDQVEMLKADNVVSDGARGLKALGVTPTPLEAVLPTYLWRYRKGGQFAQPGAANA